MKKSLLICCICSMILFGISCTPTEYDMFATLQGTVTDSQSNEPIADANIVLSPGGKNQSTNRDGKFEFKDLDATQCTVTVQKSGYSTNRKTVTLTSGETTEISITLTEN